MAHKIWRDYPEIDSALIETKRVMRDGISVRIPEIEDKINEYIDAPGKYLRAGLSLMFYYMGKGTITSKAIQYAASLEIFHLATLIHDDIIDLAATRRGIEAMHVAKGNKIAVYAGDYLLSYSGRLIAEFKDEVEITRSNGWLLESIMHGELRQLVNTFNIDMTIVEYIRQIRGKTAMLFAMSISGGYFLATESTRKARVAKLVGINLGIAFQLQDDLIDYQFSQKESGKPRMQDVQNGIYTAPLLIAMRKNKDIYNLVQSTSEWDSDCLIQLNEMIKEANGFTETEQLIDRYIDKALKYLDVLSSSPYKEKIRNMILFIANRKY